MFVVISILIPLIYETNAAADSVYEVYVKEDPGPESKNGGVPGISGLEPVTNHQMTQVINRCNNFIDESDFQSSEITFKEECVDLDTAIDSEVINIDSSVTKLIGKDALRYKVSAKVRYLKYLSNY